MFEALPRASRRQTYEQSALENQIAKDGIEARRKHAEETGVLDGLVSVNRQGLTGAIGRAFQESEFTPILGWQLPEGVEKRWQEKGIRPEQWELLARAYSDEHLEWLEHLALQNQEDAYTLSEFGLIGNLALGMTDVAGLAVDVASGGIGYATKAGRLGNMVRSGLTGAGASAVVMSSARQYNPEIELKDVVQASALSFALSGLMGARQGHLRTPVYPEAVKRAAGISDHVDTTQPLPPGTLSAMGVDPWTAGHGGKTPGAKPLRDDPEWLDAFIDRAESNWQIMPHFARARIDLAARMGKANSTVVREVGRLLFRDGVGYTDKSVAVAESTGEFAKRHLATLETQWRRGLDEAYGEYKKANGIRFYDWNARKQFNMEVGRVVRGETDVSPEALKAAQSVRESLNNALKLAQEAGLEGFDAIISNPNYLPRYWSADGFRRIFGELKLYEWQVVEGLLRPALRKAWEASGRTLEIDDELLDAVAKAWLKRAQANFEGDGMALLVRPLDADSVDEIGRLLNEAGVDPIRSQTLLAKLQRNADENGKLDRARHRIDLDENFTSTLRNASGEDVTIKVSDLLENDVEVALSRYLREITGWSALSVKAGIKTKAQLDTFVERVKKDAFHAEDKVKDIERMLDIGINATFGRSTEIDPSSTASRYGRFIRNWNFSRVMNQVGFTMFAELGPVIAHSGLRNVLRSLPEIPAMLKRGREGKLASKEAQIMEELFAPGTDLIRNPPFLRLDEDGSVALPTFESAPWLDKVTHGANHITNILSGMAPITAILQRVAGRATLLRMMEMARKAKLDDAEVQRLRTWGLDDAGQKQVFDYLKTIRKIEDINPQALPLDTRERLSAFMYRATRHQVLEGDASDSIGLMHGVTGRIVLQFRTFMFNSYTRHFLNSVHHWNDWATYQMVILSTAFAGIGWASRAYLNTIGDEKARERLLTSENFVKNAVAQSSWASVIPAVTDTVWSTFLGNDPFFEGNRSTGLQNTLMGIPTLDLANKALNSGHMITSLLDADDKITEEQMKDFWRIWWFSNLTGLRNIAEAGIDAGFPDRPDGTNRK